MGAAPAVRAKPAATTLQTLSVGKPDGRRMTFPTSVQIGFGGSSVLIHVKPDNMVGVIPWDGPPVSGPLALDGYVVVSSAQSTPAPTSRAPSIDLGELKAAVAKRDTAAYGAFLEKHKGYASTAKIRAQFAIANFLRDEATRAENADFAEAMQMGLGAAMRSLSGALYLIDLNPDIETNADIYRETLGQLERAMLWLNHFEFGAGHLASAYKYQAEIALKLEDRSLAERALSSLVVLRADGTAEEVAKLLYGNAAHLIFPNGG